MSIEIINFSPSNYERDMSTMADIEFDIVASNEHIIDFDSLKIKVEMQNKSYNNNNFIEYDTSSAFLEYYGDNPHYHVVLKPQIPFDEGSIVNVSVNIEGTDDLLAFYEMKEYRSSFSIRYNGLISDFRNIFLSGSEDIPVYNEILHKNSTVSPNVFNSAFSRWGRNKFLKIRLNQILINSNDVKYGYTIDYENGIVKFNNPLDYNDQVDASYTFSFFTDDNINNFFKMALSQYNVSPPYGGPSSIYSAGEDLSRALMVGASVFAYRNLLMLLAVQEKRVVFDNASWGDAWGKIQDMFKGQADASEESWKLILEAKKVRLPGTMSLVSPMFTMPGGRSSMFRQLYK